MESFIEIYKEEYPSLDSYWRSIILFGKNSASYKFALAKALLDVANMKKDEISIPDLAPLFSNYICSHLKHSPKQMTKADGGFLKVCKQFNDQEVPYSELIDTTIKSGFNYVLDAFHIVNGDSISTNFFKKDFHGKRKNLILTEALFKLQETGQYKNLKYETEARWRLVETAWNLGISTNLLKVEYNANDELLIVNSGVRRTDVTSVRSALNGYQKGKCFYCFNDIDLHEHQNLDVDHFIPFSLQMCFLDELNLNGVWNLVLACQSCNRGAGGKFNKVPHIKYLERLYKRNEFLINSQSSFARNSYVANRTCIRG